MSNPSILAAATDPTTGPAGVNSRVELYFNVGLIGATVLAIALVFALGVLRPSRIVGPLRVQPGRPLWPLLLVGFATVVVWLGIQMVYGVMKALELMRIHGPDRKPDMSDFTPADLAVLATVPGVVGFLIMLIGDRLAGRWTLGWLGFDFKRLPRGVGTGLVAAVVVLPLIQWVGIGLEALYKWFNYVHPKEHDLLKVIVQAPSPWAKWLLIMGAVLVAPFFEEYLFRGHLQTLLRQALLRVGRGNDGPPAFAPAMTAPPYAGAVPAAGAYSVPAAPYPYPPPAYPPPAYIPPNLPTAGPMLHPPPPGGFPGTAVPYAGAAAVFPPVPVPPSTAPPDAPPLPEARSVWPPLLAILITSLCFSVVHPMWTWPVIFVLSLFLGYAYERTGNLWACVTIHAAFNTFSTIVYLTLLN